jgi:hypothetical protein
MPQPRSGQLLLRRPERALDARVPLVDQEVAAWQAARNGAGRGVNRRFTTEDARIKLKHHYPQLRTDEPLTVVC